MSSYEKALPIESIVANVLDDCVEAVANLSFSSMRSVKKVEKKAEDQKSDEINEKEVENEVPLLTGKKQERV